MRFFLAPLASLLSFGVFWSAWRGGLPADQARGGLGMAAGLAVIGLLLGWQRLRLLRARAGQAQDEEFDERFGERQGVQRLDAPAALAAVGVGLASLLFQLAVLVTPLGRTLRG